MHFCCSLLHKFVKFALKRFAIWQFIIQFLEMAIWEPCNYVSNLAYDRLVLEICNQNDWTLEEMDVSKIAQAYALITFGSAFFHGSETKLGMLQDNISNNLFTYILHQVQQMISQLLNNFIFPWKASMKNIPYDPILHDLSITPRTMTSEEIVDYWLGKLQNQKDKYKDNVY